MSDKEIFGDDNDDDSLPPSPPREEDSNQENDFQLNEATEEILDDPIDEDEPDIEENDNNDAQIVSNTIDGEDEEEENDSVEMKVIKKRKSKKLSKRLKSSSKKSSNEDDNGDNEDDDIDDEDDDLGDFIIDDLEDDKDEIDEDLSLGFKSLRKRSKSDKSGKKKRSRSAYSRFFADEAEVADEDEEEEEDVTAERGVDDIQNKDVLEAIQRVEKRHEIQRERLGRSAEEIAKEYEERAREELRYTQGHGNNADDAFSEQRYSRVIGTSKHALLPSISDPGIFRIKCTPGKETLLLRSVMLKNSDYKSKTGITRIKSAFVTSTRGVMYIEALAEPFAKEAITGLYGFSMKSFAKVPVEEMTSIFNITFKKKPLVNGQWVRVKRGVLKGDLAQVVEIFDSGLRAIIRAVPRPDYTGQYSQSAATAATNAIASGSKKNSSTIRPPQKLFDPEELKTLTGQLPDRQRFPGDIDREMYDVFNNDFHKNGFLFKEVNVDTYIQPMDVRPRLEELRMFLINTPGGEAPVTNTNASSTSVEVSKTVNDKELNDVDKTENEDDDNTDNDNEPTTKKPSLPTSITASLPVVDKAIQQSNTNILNEIARQLKQSGNISGFNNDEVTSSLSKARATIPFVNGDLVQVTSGELKNLVGKVIHVNEVTKIVRISPRNTAFQKDLDIEANILIKYITPGAHVKVISGQLTGQTGRVVSINIVDGDHVAAILTDSTNTEIQCNVSNLQISEEVTTGLSSLHGYELYDLVVVNENETGVVINVGSEKLRVLNHLDIVKEYFPQDLHGKKNSTSVRASAFDSSQNTIKVGDNVNVINGLHLHRNGTIRHIMKGNLWLYSTSYLKNSSIFVVKARSCLLSGNVKKQSATLNDLISGNQSNIGKPTVSTHRPPPGKVAPGHAKGKASRDENISKTVRIIKGSLKGLLGHIVDVTPTHFSIELASRFKKIIIEREKVVLVGDSSGSFTAQHDVSVNPYGMGMGTPALYAETPGYLGQQTPKFGSETPGWGDSTPSSRTPNAYMTNQGGNDIWSVNETDRAKLQETNDDTISSNGGISSTWNAGQGYGSNYNGNTSTGNITMNSSYSPFQNSSVYSPSSAGSPILTVNNNQVDTFQTLPVGWQDWMPGLTAVMKHGEYVGQDVVIVTAPDQNGKLSIKLRSNLSRYPMQITVSDIVLTAISVGAKILVYSSKHKSRGTIGVVLSIQSKDIVIETTFGNKELFRASQIAVCDPSFC